MSDIDPDGRLSPKDRKRLEDFQRAVEEAQRRGEDTTPLIRSFILSSIDDVMTHGNTQVEDDAHSE